MFEGVDEDDAGSRPHLLIASDDRAPSKRHEAYRAISALLHYL